MIIAIDGPAASGKGTLARRVAARYGFHYLDSGLLYRGTAYAVRMAGHRLDDVAAATTAAANLTPETLAHPELRSDATGDAASVVAAMPEVRAALLAYQRAFAERPPGAVLDGRDIGTVICPEADVKIFVTASSEIRARRRFLELQGRGDAPSYEIVRALIESRDARDAGRGASPLRMAEDACLLETSDKDIEAAFEAALRVIERKIGR